MHVLFQSQVGHCSLPSTAKLAYRAEKDRRFFSLSRRRLRLTSCQVAVGKTVVNDNGLSISNSLLEGGKKEKKVLERRKEQAPLR